MKYFAYTPCYRKEAGSYRANERGMIRSHQFNKIEIFQFTRPEDSDDALEELIYKAERLVQGLGLHYQVSKLAARDCSASMAKTYDIEVWIPPRQYPIQEREDRQERLHPLTECVRTCDQPSSARDRGAIPACRRQYRRARGPPGSNG